MRALARVVRATAHEVRGAASALVIHMELLETALATVDDAELQARLRRYMSVLDEEQQRLLRTVEGFLGHVALPDDRESEFDLTALAGRIVAFAGPYAADHRVRLQAPSGPPVVAVGRREALAQVVLDVVLDAVESLGTQGTVDVSVEPRPDGRAVVAVRTSARGTAPGAEALHAWALAADAAGGALRAFGTDVVEVDLPVPGDTGRRAHA